MTNMDGGCVHKLTGKRGCGRIYIISISNTAESNKRIDGVYTQDTEILHGQNWRVVSC